MGICGSSGKTNKGDQGVDDEFPDGTNIKKEVKNKDDF